MSATKVIMREEDLNQIENEIKNRLGISDALVFPTGYVDGIHNAPDILELVIGGELKKYTDFELEVPDQLFIGNAEIEEVNFPEAIIVHDRAFCYSSIKNANLPKARTIESCFQDCYHLENVNIPLVQTIPQYCFFECTIIQNIVLQQASDIEYEAFGSCHNLKMVQLDSIKRIYDAAFFSCWALDTLIINQDKCICSLGGTQAFRGSKIDNGEGFIYVPDNLVEEYKTATNWSIFADQIKPLSEYIISEGV